MREPTTTNTEVRRGVADRSEVTGTADSEAIDKANPGEQSVDEVGIPVIRDAPKPALPPRPWLAAGWMAMIICAAAMFAAERLSAPPAIGLGLAVIAGFISYLAFAPWRWIRQLNEDREAIRDLAERLRQVDLAERRLPLSTVLLERADEFGELSRAMHGCLALALKQRAEARMLHRTMRDTIERRTRQATAKLERETMSDALTGAGNRRALEHFSRRLRHDRESKPVDASDELAAVMIDLDYFKEVNDTLGHEAGDDCLVFLAELLRSGARQGDLVVRMGGDEFAVLLRGCGLEGAKAFAERICSLFNLMPWSHSCGPKPSLSVGVAAVPLSGPRPVSTALREADQALYRAKRAGRNTIETVIPPNEAAA